MTPAGIGVTASSMRSRPYAAQGWRPPSRASQPRIAAANGKGVASTTRTSGNFSRMIVSR